MLKWELAAYLSAHASGGYSLDTECCEVRYEDGIYLLLQQTGGTWYITDVLVEEAPEVFASVYLWTLVKRGASMLLARVLTGWNELLFPAIP